MGWAQWNSVRRANILFSSQIAPIMSNSAHNISHEEIVELQEKFREKKSTINNVLAAMMALSEMSQRLPDYSEKLTNVVLTKAPLIVSSLQEFTQALNEKAGLEPEIGQEIAELQKKFSEIKLAINRAVVVMMARSLMAHSYNAACEIAFPVGLDEWERRRPDYSEKLASMVLTKAPLIVSSLQEFTQVLNEKAGPKPEVGQ